MFYRWVSRRVVLLVVPWRGEVTLPFLYFFFFFFQEYNDTYYSMLFILIIMAFSMLAGSFAVCALYCAKTLYAQPLHDDLDSKMRRGDARLLF
jgi:hypothetical protein